MNRVGGAQTYNPPSLLETLPEVRSCLPTPSHATLSNSLDPISQTQCGCWPASSGLRDRRKLHSSTSLPPTFCEPLPHLLNDLMAQMIPQVSSSSDILCHFCETPQT